MCVRERLFLKSHMFALCVWPPTSIAWNEGSFCSPLRPVFTGGGGDFAAHHESRSSLAANQNCKARV